MKNKPENVSHRPIVLQAALAEAHTSATLIAQTSTVPESELHTLTAFRITVAEPTLEPRVPIAIPSSSPRTTAEVSPSDQDDRSGIAELLTSLMNKVDTLTISTNERFEELSGERSRNPKPPVDFSLNIQRNMFGGPSTDAPQFATQGNQNPQAFSPLTGRLYGTRDPTLIYNSP
ncbi:unnamed protein product [Cochlearia groenlandica]